MLDIPVDTSTPVDYPQGLSISNGTGGIYVTVRGINQWRVFQLYGAEGGELYFRVNTRDPSAIWSQLLKIATATPPKEYDLPLTQGITGTAKYFKTQDDIIHITLSAVEKSQWNSGDLISNLPEGFRPSGDLWFCAAVGDGNSVIGTCDIKIQSSGEIIVAGYAVANDGAKRDISSIALFIAVKG